MAAEAAKTVETAAKMPAKSSSENSGENQEEISRPEDGSSWFGRQYRPRFQTGNTDHSTADAEAVPPDDARGTDTEKETMLPIQRYRKDSGSGSDEKPEKDIADRIRTPRSRRTGRKSNKDEDKKKRACAGSCHFPS